MKTRSRFFLRLASWLLVFLTAGCSLPFSLPDLLPVPNVVPTLHKVPTFPSAAATSPTPLPTITGTPVTAAQAGTPVPEGLQEISVKNAGLMQLVGQWGKGISRGLAVSPDGKILAVASTGGIYLYDPATLQPRGEIQTGQMQSCVSFSPDGSLLASGSWNGSLFIWKTEDKSLFRHFKGSSLYIQNLTFSPDSKRIAASTWEHVIWILDVESGEFKSSLEAHQHAVTAMAFSPDGKQLYSFATGEMALAWNLPKGTVEREIYLGKMGGNLPLSAAFSADGSLLAVNFGTQIQIFHPADGTKVRLMDEAGSAVRRALFSPDGSLLAVETDSRVDLWEVGGGTLAGQLKFPAVAKKFTGLVFTPDGQSLLGISDRLVKWSAASVAEGGEPETRPVEYNSDFVIFSRESAGSFFLAGMEGVLKSFRPDNRSMETVASFPNAVTCALAYDPAAGLSLVGGCAQKFNLWRLAEQTGKEFMPSSRTVRSLEISPDGKTLAAGTDEPALYLYQTSDESQLYRVELPASPQEIRFSPDGVLLLARGVAISLLQASDGKILHNFEGDAARFTPDGKSLLIFSIKMGTRTVQVVSTESGKTQHALTVEGGTGMAASTDGGLLAVGGDQITLWNANSGALLRRLDGGPYYGSLHFSADRRFLLHISPDGRVSVWGVP